MGEKLHIIHCDDNPFELEQTEYALRAYCSDMSIIFETASSPDELLSLLDDKRQINTVLLDVNFSDGKAMTGIDLAAKVRERYPNLTIVMLSNAKDASTIRSAIVAGADDYLIKSHLDDQLYVSILKAREVRNQKQVSTQEISGLSFKRPMVQPTIGDTMRSIRAQIPRILSSAIRSIYVFGETGVGKEVVADLFEAHLPEKIPFLRVNCGAIAPSLVESELFGHAKGAFTGATIDKVGLIEKADGGFIFLDEVATLSMQAQIALLRAIENQEIMRVGSNSVRKINVRFLSATNEDLSLLVTRGHFRHDLWQRLTEKSIYLSPLRERRNEIPELIEFFCATMPGGPYKMTKSCLELLCSISWRDGNIRQLRNCLRSMTQYCVDNTLIASSISQQYLNESKKAEGPLPPEAPSPSIDKTETSKQAPASASQELSWYVPADPKNPYDYRALSDRLFLLLIRDLLAKHSSASLRQIAAMVKVPKTTLSVHLRKLHSYGLLSEAEAHRFHLSDEDPYEVRSAYLA